MKKPLLLLAALASVLCLTAGCAMIERKLLFEPTHDPATGSLTPWTSNGALIGYARIVAAPKNVWLLLHGNGGQASDRGYALPCFSPDDSVFILEYPGYGERKGVPSQESLDRAARDGYRLLRQTYPALPVCVAGESLGTGVASSLAVLSPPPDKIVLIVPFDKLSLVAKDHFPHFLVPLILSDNWDNVAALARYPGPIDIFGAEDDQVIPIAHARALAAALPSARFFLIPGSHNGWSGSHRVPITYP